MINIALIIIGLWILAGLILWMLAIVYGFTKHGLKMTNEDLEILPKLIILGFIGIYYWITIDKTNEQDCLSTYIYVLKIEDN